LKPLATGGAPDFARRMKQLLAALWIVVPFAVAASTNEDIDAVLIEQAAAWNRGDIDGFMSHYWKSDELRFASGGNVTRGWQPTLDRYRKSYPDRAAMGKLEFSDLEVTELGPDAAIIFGRWHLVRASDAPHGLFTLTFRRIDGEWVIIQDHTSSGS
jgi:ketosteroid isomerase-like protein